MDRQRLELLTVQAGALGSALHATPDSNDKAKQRCLSFAAEIRNLVQAWNNLARALHDPQLKPRAPFNQILDIVLSDNAKIINELRTSLSEVRTKQAQYDTASRSQRWSVAPIKKGHILVSFLGRKDTTLRQLQVRYAMSVLDVILGVVLHAKTLGHEHDDRQDAQAALHDQLARLRIEAEARALVFREECRIGDKFVVSNPPFVTLALQWFEIVENPVQERHTGGTISTNDLAKIVKQVQLEMRQQNRTHQEQIQAHERQNEEMRTWAEGTIRQLEFSQQKAAQEAAAKMEELGSQLEVQKQRIESDAMTIEQLKYSRTEWTAHYQKQSERSQRLEKQMTDLKQNYLQQQEKLDALQRTYDKLYQASTRLQQQNHGLRQKLGETEAERQTLERERNDLQTRYAQVIQYNKQWKDLHESGSKERNASIDKLYKDIQDFKTEINSLKSDLTKVAGNRDQLRKSLTKVEGERDTERLRAHKLQERLAGRTSTGPSAYPPTTPDRQSRRSSRSRSRQPSSTRAASRESQSRASSATYVDDSEHEYYEQKLPRRVSGSDGAYKIASFFSTRPRQRSGVA